MDYFEYSNRQSLEWTDTYQLYFALREAQERASHYSGSMHWKKIKGSEYLYRMLDAYGQGKSLGVRSAETEKQYEAFKKGKEESKARIQSISEALDEKAALNKAVGLNRVPRVVGRIARELDKRDILDEFRVVGTNAIYAYESLAGVTVRGDLMATADVDYLWDNREKIEFAAEEDKKGGFLSVLKKADRSFERSKQECRAINKDGYMVDLIVANPKHLGQEVIDQMGSEYDLKASGIGSLKWLLNAPKVEVVVIDKEGLPFRMIAPDPCVFAVHKLWLSEQPNREPGKARRDHDQALLVASLVVVKLKQFKFEVSELKMFPKEIAERGVATLGR